MNISTHDQRNLQRLIDGELPPAEAVALRARVDAEPALRAAFAAMDEQRSRFAEVARVGIATAPGGFTASVVAAARRLPDRRELEAQDVGEGIVRVCRRLLLAAAIVGALGAFWYSGLWRAGGDHRVEAAPDEVQKEMQRLDALIESGAVGERKTK